MEGVREQIKLLISKFESQGNNVESASVVSELSNLSRGVCSAEAQLKESQGYIFAVPYGTQIYF